jgi:phosphatidylglycerophosphate synthase
MLGKFREKYQKAMEPIGKRLSRSGISPNILTFTSFIIAVISGIFFALNYLIIGLILIFITAFIDMLDGAVARASGKVTKFGAVWDHVIDRYAEFAILFGIGISFYANFAIAFLALFSMIMASFVRAKAESVGKLEKCTVGIAERQEKLIIIIIGIILTILFPVFIWIFSILDICLIVVIILSQITVYQRFKYTWVETGGN